MIAKGNPHRNGAKLADYMLKGGPGERAELLDARGFASGDLVQEFADIDLMRDAATKADAALFHVQFRSAHGEGKKLTNEQWREIIDGCDLALGRAMTQQPRAVSLHIDEATGDRHGHAAYSLLRQTDDGRFYVERLGLYERKLQLYAREVEQKYGLQIVSNERRPGARRADRNELEESRRLGTDINQIRTGILDCYQQADSGKAFKAALETREMLLANGDRRDCFVVVDIAGGQHALNKKLTGQTLAATGERLADLDRAQLPSVEAAQELQAERAAQMARERVKHGRGGNGPGNPTTPSPAPENGRQPEIKSLGKTAGEIRTAWRITQTAEQFAQEIDHRGLILVHVSHEEAAASQRARAFAKVAGRQGRALKEGFGVVDRRGSVTRIDQRTTGDQWEEIEKRLGGINRDDLLTVVEAREVQTAARKLEFAEKMQAEREATRPASWIENRIAACATDAPAAVVIDEQGRIANRAEALGDSLKNEDERQFHAATVLGAAAFFARLDDAGIAICRVTADDAQALDGLRQAEDMKRLAAEANRESYQGNRFAEVLPGELAAVTGHGDVYRLNPDKLGDATALLPENLPGVIEVRDRFAAERDDIAAHWELKRAEIDADRIQRDDAREIGRAAATAESVVEAAIDTPVAAVDEAASSGFKLSGIAARMFQSLFSVFSFGAMADTPKTAQQVRDEIKTATNEETLQADAAIKAKAEQAARLDELLTQMARSDEYKRVQNYNRSGGAEYHRPAERGEDYEREREE